MGWNAGYTIFEATVIGAYNLGKLDKDLLSVLMTPYGHTDIDSGGSQGLLTCDGKSVERVVVEVMTGGPQLPYPQTTDDDEVWEAYDEAVTSQFFEITRKHFKWG